MRRQVARRCQAPPGAPRSRQQAAQEVGLDGRAAPPARCPTMRGPAARIHSPPSRRWVCCPGGVFRPRSKPSGGRLQTRPQRATKLLPMEVRGTRSGPARLSGHGRLPGPARAFRHPCGPCRVQGPPPAFRRHICGPHQVQGLPAAKMAVTATQALTTPSRTTTTTLAVAALFVGAVCHGEPVCQALSLGPWGEWTRSDTAARGTRTRARSARRRCTRWCSSYGWKPRAMREAAQAL